MNRTMRTPLDRRQEALRQERLFRLQSQALCALVNSIGAQYGITAREGEYWYVDGEGHQRRYEVNCRVESSHFYFLSLTSSKFNDDIVLLDRVLRCLADQPRPATGKEYAEVAAYFEKGQWVRMNSYVAEFLYRRAIDAGYHPAIVKLFELKCGNWNGRADLVPDWESVYENYKEVLAMGLSQSELNEMDPSIVYVVGVEARAEHGDIEAIREIARHYLYCGKRYRPVYSRYMHQLAEKGEEDGIVYKSQYHFKKKGTLKKKAKTLFWHLKGAELGYAECMYRAGRIYELMSKETPERMRDAIRYYEMSAQEGILRSMHRLALIYAQEGTAHYDKERAEFYKGKTFELGTRY